MNSTLRQIVAVSSIVLALGMVGVASSPSVTAADVVCRSPGGIEGFEESALRAKSFFEESASRHGYITSTTSDPGRVLVYIEKTPNGYYYGSNFKGSGDLVATKIATTDPVPVRSALLNIVYHNDELTKLSSSGQLPQAARKLESSAHIVLHQSVFDDEGNSTIDVGGLKEVAFLEFKDEHPKSEQQVARKKWEPTAPDFVINADDIFAEQQRLGGLLPAKRSRPFDSKIGDAVVKAEVLERGSPPPPLLMRKILGCCLYGVPAGKAYSYTESLAKRPFAKNDIKVLSLVRDSSTERALEESPVLRGRRIGSTAEGMRSMQDVEQAFAGASGSTVVLMSHVENGQFVVHNGKGEVTFSAKIDDVRALALKQNVELIDLGCETARQTDGGVGVVSKFNTVEAVSAIERALNSASNYREFFGELTAHGMKVVIDQTIATGSSIKADVYVQEKRGFWAKVMEVFVSLRRT